MRFLASAVLLLPLIVGTVGCGGMIDRAYFNTVEKVTGKHKREIMVNRVQDARDSQEAAATEFKSALEAFRDVVQVTGGGDLQTKYDVMNDAFTRSTDRASKVTERIKAVEAVSDALFREWKDELKKFNNESLRAKSEQKMVATQERYGQMISRMKVAESKMEPVLSTLRDQTLYLKHNLNASAMSSLEGEVLTLETDVDALIADMQTAINDANAFITELESGTAQ